LFQKASAAPHQVKSAKKTTSYLNLFNLLHAMSLIVHKYGGTSMGSTERIKNVAKRVAKWQAAGHQLVVVPSAMSGETNRLIALAKDLQAEPDPRELDMICSTGEQVSVGLLAMALKAQGVKAKSYAGWQVPIKTDASHTKARISSIDDAKVRKDLADGYVVIITGFQGVTDVADGAGDITTLGRGGSDTSAVAVAAALKAEECLIYTDVDGVYTTDPRVVPEARRLEKITFEEMLEMASLGSKVLQIRSVEFAGKYRVKTRVLSSLTDPMMDLKTEAHSGTLITFEDDTEMEQAVVSGIAFSRDEAKITLVGVPDKPGIAYQILGPIADANVDVDVIIQNTSTNGFTDFSFTVSRGEYNKAMEVIKGVQAKLGAKELVGDTKVCKVSIVGIGMKSHVGVAATMFRALSNEGINIQMISTSEIKTSVVLEDKYMELAVRALHKAFELEQQA
jgi:aspartate kinase